MTHLFAAPRRAAILSLTLALSGVSLLGATGLPGAEAAAPPAVVQPDASSGVTADVLPTTQINAGGYVQDQAVVGDAVYAGGSFSSARPAGAAAGTSESRLGTYDRSVWRRMPDPTKQVSAVTPSRSGMPGGALSAWIV